MPGDAPSSAAAVALADPCAFGPSPEQARSLAEFYVRRFAPGDRVLDIGFGKGYFLEAARRAGLQAVGVDRDPALVAAARERGHVAHCLSVAEIPEVVEGRFDGALASHLIEHLGPAEVRILCADVAAAVRPGGVFVIATPNFRDLRVATDWFWLDASHVRPYPPAALEQLLDREQWQLTESGWEPVRVTRNVLRLALDRIRFGRDYGHPGSWYVLRRR